MQIMGKDYQLIKTMGIMEDMAQNQAAAGAGAGMGMGMAAFGLMGQLGQNTLGPTLAGVTAQTPPQQTAQQTAQPASAAAPAAVDPQAQEAGFG